MGYSTTIYAVDLDVLRSAIGSQDMDLVERLRKLESGKPVDPTKGPRVKLALNSDIFLNGKLVTWEEFKVAIIDPKWSGTDLYKLDEQGRRTGRWSETGSFSRALQQVLGQVPAALSVSGIYSCDSEQELLTGWQDSEEISEEAAAEELITGTISVPDAAHQYGYGLELICQLVGTRLGSIGGKRRMKALKLDTPLATTRVPISLPEYDDFPYISHLSDEEVCEELSRLRAMDLSYPKSRLIERDRQVLLGYLEDAGQQELGVVAFYY